jgi:endo-1,4-beta-xylanase
MASFSRASSLAGLLASLTLGCLSEGTSTQEGSGGTSESRTGSGGTSASGGSAGSGGAGSGGAGSGGAGSGGAGSGGRPGSGGAAGSGGSSSSGGTTTSGGTTGTGGKSSAGGTSGSGGVATSGGTTGSGGTSTSGGSTGSGGIAGSGGTSSAGGVVGSGGIGRTGGVTGTGAVTGRGGTIGNGGQTGAGGTGAGGSTADAGTSPTEFDCTNIPAMPTGGTEHSGNSQGGKDNLAWQIWSNGSPGYLTTFSTPAFIARWNNSGDYLGRLGFEWGNSGKAYTAYGTIKADVAFKKSGNAGQYSYVGIYGWSTNPCIEWYIVDDSFHTMPFNTGDPVVGTFELDGGTYNLVKRNTSGTGGNRCGNVTRWDQFYSIRKTGRQCGTISISDHFKKWDSMGWKLGNLLEAKIVVEAAGGVGNVEFPVANVTTTQ